ncbi:MAG TPA: Uma2 family endonuclease [Bryobacteraceae bacterium]
MAARAESLLMTVEQFREIPAPDSMVQELHWGQVITLTRPKMKHTKLQYRLVELLRPIVEGKGIVMVELPFRAVPEYDLRGADVAFITQDRWNKTADDDNLHGSPELVIEILSPWNTKAEIQEKAALCLSTGCQEFWIVDPRRKSVNATRRGGETTVYTTSERIPLALFGSELAVAAIFA